MTERQSIEAAAAENGWTIDETAPSSMSWTKGDLRVSAMFDRLPSGGTDDVVKGTLFVGGWGADYKKATVYTGVELAKMLTA